LLLEEKLDKIVLDKPIILYDGICNFCTGIVKFIIRHDRNNSFYFASLQSKTGKNILARFGLAHKEFDSFVYVDEKNAYAQSTAGLKLMKKLGFPWNLVHVLIIVPAPMRDAIYRWFARHRYKWFGKKDSCMVPDKEIKSRFLDWEDDSQQSSVNSQQ
jgi:predicted DCC family thiol-disulfide oxidoreductase YuxK